MSEGSPTTRSTGPEHPVRELTHDRSHARVIVADDEESMRYFLRRGLARHGFDVEAVECGADALARFDARRADVAVVDLKMPGMDGIEVLSRIRASHPEASVILMTAFGTIDSAVEAMKLGAFDYITKPFELEELVSLIVAALEQRAAARRGPIDRRASTVGLIGESPALRKVFRAIDLLQRSDATVLIAGDSGTGKELVARAIHLGSERARRPFVPLHCAALRDTLVENELFGHEPGAYTGAQRRKHGLLAKADGGTLFLDEVSEISLPTQAKLERFLQEREFVPLGGSEPIRVDLRIMAATNCDLQRSVDMGKFRRELFFRLNVVPIHLPPLRERREDVPLLIAHFLEGLAESPSIAVEGFTIDAMFMLTQYDWPGNVRQLQNIVERLAVLNAGKTVLDVGDLPEEIRGQLREGRGPAGAEGSVPYHEARCAFEREYLATLFRQTRGNISETARIAQISRGHLHRKIKQLELDPDEFR